MACIIVPTGCGRVWLETRSDVSVLSGPQPRGYQGNINITPVLTDKGVWVASDTFPLLILPPTIGQVVCYPGSTWIFSASRDKTVLMWDLNQGDEPIQEFCGHELVVNGVAISPGTHRHTDFFHSPQSHLSWIAMTSCCVLPSVPCECGSVYWVLCRREKAVHRFTWQLDVPVGHRICKMRTQTEYFQKLGEFAGLVGVALMELELLHVCAPSVCTWPCKKVHTSFLDHCFSLSRSLMCVGYQAAPL